MKYFATIDGQTYEITVDGSGSITIDGEAVPADLARVPGQNLYSLLLDHLSHELWVEPEPDVHNEFGVLVSGHRYVVKVQDERARRLTSAERRMGGSAGEVSVRAPIPGLVVKVLVEPGQEVTEGQTLIILEAMKMENELRAPHAGTVREVRAQPGAQVSLGQVLVSVRTKE